MGGMPDMGQMHQQIMQQMLEMGGMDNDMIKQMPTMAPGA